MIPATGPMAFFLSTASPEALALPMVMLTIFASAKLLAEIFERLGISGIVGEIFAGMLIGPSVLAWVAPNDLVTSLADLGVMFLLFRVGLEVKPQELLKLGGSATLVAVSGVIVPMIMGWGIMRFWGSPQIEAIFVGAAMVATSVVIHSQVLVGTGLLEHQ